ncbi:hypothetical protein ABT025_19350 [Streptomyces sp. NPDC002809]|uniref:hypothetical protein n=1 Tax=Streptomyces sp. NPDC002809 TaxID=3154433 RepID=UPI003323D792
MKPYLVTSVVLLALLIAASGVAAITRGWVLPTNRKPIRSIRLYGWGQLVVSFGLCWEAVFALVITDIGARQWGTLAGSALLLAGLFLMMLSWRKRDNRQSIGQL